MAEGREDPALLGFIFEGKFHKEFETITGKNSIHNPDAIKFYRETLNADRHVLTILEQGLKFPFHSDPSQYEERNNKSARDNKELVWTKMTEWEAAKYVKRVDTKPRCVNPLSVAEKLDLESKTTKKRVCADFSRHVNDFMVPTPVKLCSLAKSEALLDRGDFQAGMDLENQYFHVRIHPDHHKFLGCQAEDPSTGKSHYFVFNVMIYGCKPAAAVVTRLTYPIVKHLHEQGIKFSIYMDDGRTVADSSEVTMKHHLYVQKTFTDAGWNIQHKKTCKVPTQMLYHQGFICDTKNMIYKLPEFKIHHLEEIIDEVIEGDLHSVEARTLARVIGKINSCERAIGPLVRVMLRSTQMSLNHEVIPKGWDTRIVITKRIKEDLKFIRDNLKEDNGQPIVNHKTGVLLNSLLS
jgi:hypothetical protein